MGWKFSQFVLQSMPQPEFVMKDLVKKAGREADLWDTHLAGRGGRLPGAAGKI